MNYGGMASTVVKSLACAPLWMAVEYLCGFLAKPYAAYVDKSDEKLEKKLVAWTGNVSSHGLQCLFWWVYALSGETWIFDIFGWVVELEPTEARLIDRPRVLPVYIMYLGYAWHSLQKDVRRSWGNFHQPMQAMFLFHHLLTIFLVALSIEHNCWRAGVLTRLAHDPADIMIYTSKIYIAAYEKGKGSYLRVCFIYVITVIVWVSTRVVLYGWVNYCLHVMYLAKVDSWEPTHQIVCVSLLIGSWVMWILQVIWSYALGASMYQFVTTGHQPTDSIDKGQNGSAGDSKKTK